MCAASYFLTLITHSAPRYREIGPNTFRTMKNRQKSTISKSTISMNSFRSSQRSVSFVPPVTAHQLDVTITAMVPVNPTPGNAGSEGNELANRMATLGVQRKE